LREWTGELTNSRTDRSAKAGIESVSTRLHSTPGLTGITKVSRRLKGVGQESLLRTIVTGGEWCVVPEWWSKWRHGTWLTWSHSWVGGISRVDGKISERVANWHQMRWQNVGHWQVGWRLSRSDGRDERLNQVSGSLLELSKGMEARFRFSLYGKVVGEVRVREPIVHLGSEVRSWTLAVHQTRVDRAYPALGPEDLGRTT
jgi:hypothetical protein